jgi:hypothetical protein
VRGIDGDNQGQRQCIHVKVPSRMDDPREGDGATKLASEFVNDGAVCEYTLYGLLHLLSARGRLEVVPRCLNEAY